MGFDDAQSFTSFDVVGNLAIAAVDETLIIFFAGMAPSSDNLFAGGVACDEYGGYQKLKNAMNSTFRLLMEQRQITESTRFKTEFRIKVNMDLQWERKRDTIAATIINTWMNSTNDRFFAHVCNPGPDFKLCFLKNKKKWTRRLTGNDC